MGDNRERRAAIQRPSVQSNAPNAPTRTGTPSFHQPRSMRAFDGWEGSYRTLAESPVFQEGGLALMESLNLYVRPPCSNSTTGAQVVPLLEWFAPTSTSTLVPRTAVSRKDSVF